MKESIQLLFTGLLTVLISTLPQSAQATISVVAADQETRQVGLAAVSCPPNGAVSDPIGESISLFAPDKGVLTSQAWLTRFRSHKILGEETEFNCIDANGDQVLSRYDDNQVESMLLSGMSLEHIRDYILNPTHPNGPLNCDVAWSVAPFGRKGKQYGIVDLFGHAISQTGFDGSNPAESFEGPNAGDSTDIQGQDGLMTFAIQGNGLIHGQGDAIVLMAKDGFEAEVHPTIDRGCHLAEKMLKALESSALQVTNEHGDLQGLADNRCIVHDNPSDPNYLTPNSEQSAFSSIRVLAPDGTMIISLDVLQGEADANNNALTVLRQKFEDWKAANGCPAVAPDCSEDPDPLENITNDASNRQDKAKVSGDNVLYLEKGLDADALMVRSLSNPSEPANTIAFGARYKGSDIDGSLVAYSDDSSGKFQVYIVDLNDPSMVAHPIGGDVFSQENPSIDGMTLVWEQRDSQPRSPAIHSCELSPVNFNCTNEHVLSDQSVISTNPKVLGEVVVFESEYQHHRNIFRASLLTPLAQPVHLDPQLSNQTNPSIGDSGIVWQDFRDAKSEIFKCDFGPGSGCNGATYAISDGAKLATNLSLSVSGDRVVWDDLRHGQTDIYVYDGTSEQRLTSHCSRQESVDIDGDNIVLSGIADAISDIYHLEIQSGESNTPPVIGDIPNPLVLDSNNSSGLPVGHSFIVTDAEDDLAGIPLQVMNSILPQGVSVGIGTSGPNERLLTVQHGTPYGEHEISIIARDSQGLFDVKTFTLKLAPNNSACFIATAAYGTPMHEDINILRKYRDDVMLKSKFGAKLVDTYYKYSPPIADKIAEREWARKAVRAALKPIVKATDWWLNR